MNNNDHLQKIYDFFGSNKVSLGTATKTPDECIGFARKLLYGNDPHSKIRVTYSDGEYSNIPGTPQPPVRSGDYVARMSLMYGFLSWPPSMHKVFWSTSMGKSLLRSMPLDSELPPIGK